VSDEQRRGGDSMEYIASGLFFIAVGLIIWHFQVDRKLKIEIAMLQSSRGLEIEELESLLESQLEFATEKETELRDEIKHLEKRNQVLGLELDKLKHHL